MLVESDGEHDEDTGEHAEDLEDDGQPVALLLLVGGDWVGVAGGELRHHVHQGHVQKYSCKKEERKKMSSSIFIQFLLSPPNLLWPRTSRRRNCEWCREAARQPSR